MWLGRIGRTLKTLLIGFCHDFELNDSLLLAEFLGFIRTSQDLKTGKLSRDGLWRRRK